jgi:hypothetical protein
MHPPVGEGVDASRVGEPVTLATNDLLIHGKSHVTYNSNLLSQTHPGSSP